MCTQPGTIYIGKATLALAAAIMLTACGGGSKKVAVEGGTAESEQYSATASKIACDGSNCPSIVYNLHLVNGASSNGAFLANVGEDANWVFMAAPKYKGESLDVNEAHPRPAGLFIDPNTLPSGANVVDDGGNRLPESLQVNWTPSSIGKSTKDLIVYIRDMKKCAGNESSEDKCNRKVPNKDYDQEFTNKWEAINLGEGMSIDQVANGANGAVTVSNPNCGQGATTDGQLTMGVIQAGAGVLGNMANGNIMGVILDPTVIGALINGGSQETGYIQCLH